MPVGWFLAAAESLRTYLPATPLLHQRRRISCARLARRLRASVTRSPTTRSTSRRITRSRHLISWWYRRCERRSGTGCARAIDIQRSVFDEAQALVDRQLSYEIARYVFGADAEFRRRASEDKILKKALDLARGARSEQDLLRRATAEAPADTAEAVAGGGGGR